MSQRLTCGHSQPIDKREHFLVPALPAQVPKISLWQGLPQARKSKQPAKGRRRTAFADIIARRRTICHSAPIEDAEGKMTCHVSPGFSTGDSLQSLTLDSHGDALQLRDGVDEVLTGAQVEFPAVPRAAQDAAFMPVGVFVDRRGERGTRDLAHTQARRRAGKCSGKRKTHHRR